MDRSVEDTEQSLFLRALLEVYQYDFRGYSPASIARRLDRACSRFECESLSMLQHRLLHEPAILPELVSLLTVQVSEMFRDPGYFRGLRDHVLPLLATFPSLKVWVAGCGDGEELYSLVILFREEGLEQRSFFYATDISAAALERARAGIFPLDRIAEFTRNHQLSGARSSLSDYYHAAQGAAVFDKSLRSRVVFSDHNLACDEVFAEVHLVSCRNVLIYFDRALQDRAFDLFRRSVVRNGFLGLGASERLPPEHEGAFAEFLPESRVYRRVGAMDGFYV